MDQTPLRIKQAMELRGYKQADLVEKTGISKGALSSYLSGRYSPKQNNVFLLAKALNVNEAWLMGADVPMEESTTKPDKPDKPRGYSGNSTPHYTDPEDFKTGYWIPVLGDVAAGMPIEAHEDILDWEQLDEALRGTGTHFALRIKGSSMEPRMMDGDVVIVRQQADAESGEIVIVKVNGDCATCKRLLKQDDGITLIPYNPAFPPISYTAEEVQTKPVVILGKVIELRGKFK